MQHSLSHDNFTSKAPDRTPPSAGGRDAPGRLSDELAALISVFAERSVTIGEVMEVLQGRGYTLLLVLISLPFCTPVPLPGVSTPFGMVVAMVGFRLALGKKPWLPRRLLRTRIPAQFFPRLLGAARRLIKFLEYFLRPRWNCLFKQRLVTEGCGAAICVMGCLLLIPIPIPFSNGLPALTVVLIGSAILERDGYCLAGGLIMFVITLGFFFALTWGGAELMGWLQHHLPGQFGAGANSNAR